jgi:hypothetical protein
MAPPISGSIIGGGIRTGGLIGGGIPTSGFIGGGISTIPQSFGSVSLAAPIVAAPIMAAPVIGAPLPTTYSPGLRSYDYDIPISRSCDYPRYRDYDSDYGTRYSRDYEVYDSYDRIGSRFSRDNGLSRYRDFDGPSVSYRDYTGPVSYDEPRRRYSGDYLGRSDRGYDRGFDRPLYGDRSYDDAYVGYGGRDGGRYGSSGRFRSSYDDMYLDRPAYASRALYDDYDVLPRRSGSMRALASRGII